MYAFLYIYSVYLKFILLSKFDFCELLWAWAFLKFLADLKKKVESESEHALKKSIKIAYIIQTLNLELTSELWIVQSLLVLTFDFRIWTTMITCGFRVVARVLSLSTKVAKIFKILYIPKNAWLGGSYHFIFLEIRTWSSKESSW